jgi:hypothetical protein
MINPAKPEIKAARPRTYTTLWDTIIEELDKFSSLSLQRLGFASLNAPLRLSAF